MSTSTELLDTHYNRAKSFDFEKADLKTLEKEAEMVAGYLAVENYKTVHKFFSAQAFQNSSDPYQDVCDNYRDFKELLKEYEPMKNKVDYMKIAVDTILTHLNYGNSNCHNWVKEDYYDHYREVNHSVNYWERVLIEQSGYDFS